VCFVPYHIDHGFLSWHWHLLCSLDILKFVICLCVFMIFVLYGVAGGNILRALVLNWLCIFIAYTLVSMYEKYLLLSLSWYCYNVDMWKVGEIKKCVWKISREVKFCIFNFLV
jgi:hypothetical protein